VAVWEQADSWDGKAKPAIPPPEPPPAQVPGRITLADAVKVFLSNREGAKIAPPTLRKYRTFTKQLTTFAESRGYVMLDQFTSSDIARQQEIDASIAAKAEYEYLYDKPCEDKSKVRSGTLYGRESVATSCARDG
jgi:hypothetical protein